MFLRKSFTYLRGFLTDLAKHHELQFLIKILVTFICQKYEEYDSVIFTQKKYNIGGLFGKC